MSKKITQEEFENKAKEKNKYIKVLGNYVNSREKVDCQCLLCGEIFQIAPDNIYAGKKHSKCAIKLSAKSRTKTHGQFIKEMKNIQPNIIIVDEYNGAFNVLKCYCNIHNEYFMGAPTHLLEGKCGCEKCKSEKIRKKLIKSNEDFIKEAKIKNSNIEIIGSYNSSNSPVEVRCLKCGFIWSPIAGSILSGFGCPKCVGRHKTTEEFKKEMEKINPNIEIIGEYAGSKIKTECKCKVCSNVWLAKPSNLRYTGCPVCCESHGERRIRKYLSDYKINFIPQKTYNELLGVGGRNLSYDFYLPDYNILIEYQGEFHDGTAYQQSEEEYKIQQEHDKRKHEYAELHNIKLLEIWYWNFDNIEEILEREIHINI